MLTEDEAIKIIDSFRGVFKTQAEVGKGERKIFDFYQAMNNFESLVLSLVSHNDPEESYEVAPEPLKVGDKVRVVGVKDYNGETGTIQSEVTPGGFNDYEWVVAIPGGFPAAFRSSELERIE